MSILSLVLPVLNKPDSTEDPKIITAFTTIQNLINGNLDSSNVKAGSLTGDRLASATVEGKSVGSEIPKRTGAYTALTARATGGKYLVSASRPATVSLTIQNTGSLPITELQVLAGGVVIAVFQYIAKTEDTRSYVFPLPANVEWEPKAIAGVFNIQSSYLIE